MESIIIIIRKIRRSFTTQLTIWVGGGVLLISAVVILLLARFSQEVIRDESIEITQTGPGEYGCENQQRTTSSGHLCTA